MSQSSMIMIIIVTERTQVEESSVKKPIDKVRTPLEWNREYTSCKAAEATEQDFSNEKLFVS